MRLAMQTDYALRTLMYLAFRKIRCTATEVAEFYGISGSHVAKVVNQLSRLGYIRSIRGAGGGIELAREIEKISVGEVIQAFEGQMHLLDCVGTKDVCAIQKFCKLVGVLAESEKRQMDYLNSVSLADVIPTNKQAQKHAREMEKS